MCEGQIKAFSDKQARNQKLLSVPFLQKLLKKTVHYLNEGINQNRKPKNKGSNITERERERGRQARTDTRQTMLMENPRGQAGRWAAGPGSAKPDRGLWEKRF